MSCFIAGALLSAGSRDSVSSCQPCWLLHADARHAQVLPESWQDNDKTDELVRPDNDLSIEPPRGYRAEVLVAYDNEAEARTS